MTNIKIKNPRNGLTSFNIEKSLVKIIKQTIVKINITIEIGPLIKTPAEIDIHIKLGRTY